MSRRVLRYEVPVDDQWHEITTDGLIVHVGCRASGVVEFWTCPAAARYTDPDMFWQNGQRTVQYRVFGTGHPLDDGFYVGTTYDVDPALVWHLFLRTPKAAS